MKETAAPSKPTVTRDKRTIGFLRTLFPNISQVNLVYRFYTRQIFSVAQWSINLRSDYVIIEQKKLLE